MNTYHRTRLFFLVCWMAPFFLRAQNHAEEITGYREKQAEEITSGDDSPLWPEDVRDLSYFEIDDRYRVPAGVELLKGEKPFDMPTYAGTTKEFIRHARLHFEIGGVRCALTVYRDLSIPGPLAKLNPLLFIPFTDETGGTESYGGGRYLDLAIPRDAGQISLDFNKAYNPYCAYSDGYRCPVPPRENRLPVRTSAGEKDYHGIRRSRGVRPAGKPQ